MTSESNPWFVAVAVPVANAPTKMMNSNGLAMGAPAAAAAVSAADAGGEHEEQQGEEDGDGGGSPKQAVNPGEEEKVESGPVTATPNAACGFQER